MSFKSRLSQFWHVLLLRWNILHKYVKFSIKAIVPLGCTNFLVLYWRITVSWPVSTWKTGTFICVFNLFRKLGVNPEPEKRLTFCTIKPWGFWVFHNLYQEAKQYIILTAVVLDKFSLIMGCDRCDVVVLICLDLVWLRRISPRW